MYTFSNYFSFLKDVIESFKQIEVVSFNLYYQFNCNTKRQLKQIIKKFKNANMIDLSNHKNT